MSEEETGQGEDDVQPESGAISISDIVSPYLEEVPEEYRDVVAERLEAFRKDADRNANKKIQQQAEKLKSYEALGNSEELEMITAIWQNLLSDPVDTVKWVAERFAEEQDRDLKTELIEAFGAAVKMTEETVNNEEETVKSLTKEDVEKMLQEFSAQLQSEAKQVEEFDQYVTQANGWIREAAKHNHLTIDAQDEDIIVRRATALIEKGVVDNGKDAIDMATEAFGNRLRELAKANQTSTPRVAEGGKPVNIAEQFDLDTSKGRKDAVEAMLQSAINS